MSIDRARRGHLITIGAKDARGQIEGAGFRSGLGPVTWNWKTDGEHGESGREGMEAASWHQAQCTRNVSSAWVEKPQERLKTGMLD